ncbi:hypothetical protein ACUN0C_18565 [Faunimonas sp. B44]|uniref:hypothetical protein n=1 Tax=Faunimonas sp. B44 TaxID=3461493 RepID=UPI00404428BA
MTVHKFPAVFALLAGTALASSAFAQQAPAGQQPGQQPQAQDIRDCTAFQR